MRTVLTAITVLILVGSVVVGAPSAARAVEDTFDATYFISTSAADGSTGCDDPFATASVEGDDFDDALTSVLNDIDSGNYSNAVVKVCGDPEGEDITYSINARTQKDLAGLDEGPYAVTIVGVEYDSELPLDSFEEIMIEGGDTQFLDLTDADLTIKNLTFSNMTVEGGGAVVSLVRGDADEVHLTLDTVQMASSDAVWGGAVYVEGSAVVSNSLFGGNSAVDQGGAIYADGSLTVTNSTFDENTAGEGGAISFFTGSLTVSDGSTFTNNTSLEDDGGAIYAYNADSVTVDDSVFGDPDDDEAGNSSEWNGGDIAVGVGIITYLQTDLTIKNSKFYDSQAGEDGGAISAVCAATTMSGTTVRGAYAGDSGSALFVDGSSGLDHICGSSTYTVTVANSSFSDNAAEVSGTIYAGDGDPDELSELIVKASTFKDNDGTNSSVIDTWAVNLNVSRSEFADNTSNGNVMRLCGSSDAPYTVAITGSRFERNTSENDGAVIGQDCEINNLSLVGNSFLSNESYGHGGVLSLELDNSDGGVAPVTRILSNKFINNGAEHNGGVFDVYVGDVFTDMEFIKTVKRNTFRGNRSDSDRNGYGSGNIFSFSYDWWDDASTARRLEMQLKRTNTIQGSGRFLVFQPIVY
jgi:predicted outer membrane repeat protein